MIQIICHEAICSVFPNKLNTITDYILQNASVRVNFSFAENLLILLSIGDEWSKYLEVEFLAVACYSDVNADSIG